MSAGRPRASWRPRCRRLHAKKQRCVGPCSLPLSWAIHAAGRAGDLQAAESAFRSADELGGRPSTATFNNLLRVCAQSERADRAQFWMSELLSSGGKPDATSFNIVIEACLQIPGGLPRAEQWLHRMSECGVCAEAITFSMIIFAHARANNVSGAISWLDKMEGFGIVGSTRIYRAIIAACSRAQVGGHLKAVAEQIFRRFRAHGRTDIAAYTAMAQGSVYAGDFQAVERLQAEMERDGIAVNDKFLAILLFAYSRAKPKAHERARAVFIANGPSISRLRCEKNNLWKALQACIGTAEASQMWSEYAVPCVLGVDSTGCLS